MANGESTDVSMYYVSDTNFVALSAIPTFVQKRSSESATSAILARMAVDALFVVRQVG